MDERQIEAIKSVIFFMCLSWFIFWNKRNWE